MSESIKAEIRKELLNKWLLYQPLKESTFGFEMFSINGTDPSVQHLFQLPVNNSTNNGASTSTDGTRPFVNPARSSMPPPPPPSAKKPMASRFEETVVIGKDRACQLCDRSYKNKRHQNMFREQNICCVCRYEFPDEPTLKQHNSQTLKAVHAICCVKDCNWPLSDDPETNEYHFNRHGPKKSK